MSLLAPWPPSCLERVRKWLLGTLLVTLAAATPAGARLHKAKSDLGEVLRRMNEAGKHLKTVTAHLDYTTVTVLVNDRSTESGSFYLRNPKAPEILIDFEKPDPKQIVFKHNRAEIYYPRMKQIEEYHLERHGALLQQFLLLGFGTQTPRPKAAYAIKLVGEEELDRESTAVLELTPKRPEVSSQLSRIKIWVSEDSWLPGQQQFFEPGGDYLIARYSAVRVNRPLPSSTFRINAAPGTERVEKN